MNIFAGNLLFEATEDDVRKLFQDFGAVDSVVIVMEKKGGKSRGFGFVEMPDTNEAREAINTLNGKMFMGRDLIVSEAKPKSEGEKNEERELRLQAKLETRAKARLAKAESLEGTGHKPAPGKQPVRKIGRRTRRFLEKRAAAGINEPLLPRPKHHVNPMRWRKKHEQSKPWHKNKAVLDKKKGFSS